MFNVKKVYYYTVKKMVCHCKLIQIQLLQFVKNVYLKLNGGGYTGNHNPMKKYKKIVLASEMQKKKMLTFSYRNPKKIKM